MKFCPECGNNIEGKKFCSECGYKVEGMTNVAPAPLEADAEKELLKFSTYMFGMDNQKANIGGKFDLTLPKFNYTLTTERLIIEKQGVVSKKQDDIELFLIKDINLIQGMKDKLLKVGDLEIISSDNSSPNILIKRIQEPKEVREIIRKAVREARKAEGLTYRQNI